ncbi:MAG TPA: cytochrome c oxidase accessory protein CcoG [Polaromonas sp.]|uniref:cytochrome c oxidase accessory protein CcoG n=1 Tax=Polaromonas sp. TaxID=1869339 RepID=UPI002D5BA3F5|nr:cytochrome c oxidase accessory protein CcoG [Polaromonas sp.]HYW58046.1 cytochrome c oxidase accessory protein CcoG [Polaromonas sp.]
MEGRPGGPVGPVGQDDSSTIASLYRSEQKIYARGVSGWFNRWRWALVWATQLVFYGLPWLSMNDRQAMLFDLVARRFYIFNLVLYPQDLIYLTGLLIVSALSLFLFTAVAGRLWCGYACPQTVYTEIFMWVERKIEGDRIARMRLDKAPMGGNKLLRKGLKHAVWIAIGLWTGFTFVGYFTPIKELAGAVSTLSLGPWESFWVLFYGFATYGNAGWMREQVCKYMCPYARFQSAMFDRDTLIVTYDEARGEGRGSRPRSDTPAQYKAKGLGDCIDCGLCVQVCPTGIDIRNGLQYECISCSACIDVCDGVMDKMHYPRGLIRNSTQNGITKKLSRAQMFRRVLRPRVLIYSGVLAVVSLGLLWSLFSRHSFRVDVVRDRGSMARVVGQGQIENVYRLQIMNATEHGQQYLIQVTGLDGARVVTEGVVMVDAAESRWVPVRVQLPPDAASPGSHPIDFSITTQGLVRDEVIERSVFLVPR